METAIDISRLMQDSLPMSRAPELLEMVGTLMRVMLVSERTPPDFQHAIPYNPLDFNTIGFLRMNPGSRASQVSDHLGVKPTTTSSVIARLVKRGVIERRKDAKDGRAASLVLTQEGQKLAETLFQQDLKNMALFLSALNEKEQVQLLKLLSKVTQRVQSLDAPTN